MPGGRCGTIRRFSRPQSRLTPELVVAEVRDTIDQLNERPDSTGRAPAAVDVFLGNRTEDNRAAAEAAFLAVPASQRRYALDDSPSGVTRPAAAATGPAVFSHSHAPNRTCGGTGSPDCDRAERLLRAGRTDRAYRRRSGEPP
ncbi:hypothetical protein ACFC4H_14130 [Streptomyces rubiginosohelvolus]|uniref:DUF7639 domain-containing protein n=1 Tax=Streptomyces rubiginosohelvolus TaxID=67362 RepID=UPI0035D58592